MSRLAAWFLTPPVYARLSERYRCYRRNKASGFSAACGCFWVALAWLFLPLENANWQRVREQHQALFPHINPDKPRPLDPARYLLQVLWLLATLPQRRTAQDSAGGET